MFWIVCGAFMAGVFVGVIFMALLSAAREPEAEHSSSKEANSTAVWNLSPRDWESGITAAKTANQRSEVRPQVEF